MGKRHYYAKARQNTSVEIVNPPVYQTDGYAGIDVANALALPSKKRKTNVIRNAQPVVRILSKKQRKTLKKLLDRKKKKENRTVLLENLESVEISNEELEQYTSISTVQTIGIKNFLKVAKTDEDTRLTKKVSKLETFPISSVTRFDRKRKSRLADECRNSFIKRCKNGESKKLLNMNLICTNKDANKNSETIDEKYKSSSEKIAKQSLMEKNSPTLEDNIEHINDELKLERKPSIYMHLEREPHIQAERLKLPILAEEAQIMEAVNSNSVVLIAGETGSGKTTQIPQFLYEAGYAQDKLIGITEPRRVAALSMSKRVADEMSLSNRVVSYLIRFEGNVTEETKIKFMTDGVLLKEIEGDFLLSRYSVIILDEAHERSIYTDILIGLLSRIVPLRLKRGNPLKWIIMSATLKIEDFIRNRNLFPTPPPVLKVEARQYPVTIHFQKHTDANYIKAVYKKTLKIHSKLPEGGILIFVTGQDEVNYIVRKLRKTYPFKGETKRRDSCSDLRPENNDDFDLKRAIRTSKKSKKNIASQITVPKINLDNYRLPTEDTDPDLLVSKEGFDLNSESDDDLASVKICATTQSLWVLPMYSLLTSQKQQRVFEPPPSGSRLCVVSTNIAETSLTIPNIKYVVDSGRQKTRLYDKLTGVSTFVVTFTSKASANQRAGRAGRVSPGHCYRLYSRAVFKDEFEDFSMPDIQKKPVDDLFLQMKCMGIDKVSNFPFPSPPDREQLEIAEKRLKWLGALEDVSNKTKSHQYLTKVTELGRSISAFPVAPRFGKMLALSHQQNLLPYTVCMVAALSVREVLLEAPFGDQANEAMDSKKSKWLKKRRTWAASGNYKLLGDPMILLQAVGAAEYAGMQGKLENFCEENGLRHKAIIEIRKLRMQITNEINLHIPRVNLSVDPKMEPPSDLQAKFLRQILLSGMGDQIARKIHDKEVKTKELKRNLKYAYECCQLQEPIFMHKSSILKKVQPEWVIYQDVFQHQSDGYQKIFMRGITGIEPEWLLVYAPNLCNITSYKENPSPRFDTNNGKIYSYVDATFGSRAWALPPTEIEMPLSERTCKYFGKFFLEGVVFSKIAVYKSKLKYSPSSVVKNWSNLNPSLTCFNEALYKKKIYTKQTILDVWKADPTYLLQEYSELLHNVDCSELYSIWPPVDS